MPSILGGAGIHAYTVGGQTRGMLIARGMEELNRAARFAAQMMYARAAERREAKRIEEANKNKGFLGLGGGGDAAAGAGIGAIAGALLAPVDGGTALMANTATETAKQVGTQAGAQALEKGVEAGIGTALEAGTGAALPAEMSAGLEATLGAGNAMLGGGSSSTLGTGAGGLAVGGPITGTELASLTPPGAGSATPGGVVPASTITKTTIPTTGPGTGVWGTTSGTGYNELTTLGGTSGTAQPTTNAANLAGSGLRGGGGMSPLRSRLEGALIGGLIGSGMPGLAPIGQMAAMRSPAWNPALGMQQERLGMERARLGLEQSRFDAQQGWKQREWSRDEARYQNELGLGKAARTESTRRWEAEQKVRQQRADARTASQEALDAHYRRQDFMEGVGGTVDRIGGFFDRTLGGFIPTQDNIKGALDIQNKSLINQIKQHELNALKSPTPDPYKPQTDGEKLWQAIEHAGFGDRFTKDDKFKIITTGEVPGQGPLAKDELIDELMKQAEITKKYSPDPGLPTEYVDKARSLENQPPMALANEASFRDSLMNAKSEDEVKAYAKYMILDQRRFDAKDPDPKLGYKAWGGIEDALINNPNIKMSPEEARKKTREWLEGWGKDKKWWAAPSSSSYAW